jgi:hypothetical protein
LAGGMPLQRKVNVNFFYTKGKPLIPKSLLEFHNYLHHFNDLGEYHDLARNVLVRALENGIIKLSQNWS